MVFHGQAAASKRHLTVHGAKYLDLYFWGLDWAT